MAETVLIDGKSIQVDGKMAPGNVVVLTVRYRSEVLMHPEAAVKMSDTFLKVYRETLAAFQLPAGACVIAIQSDKGASALGRAFIDLYQEVVEVRGRKLAVAGYPELYLDDILTLGFSQLDDFFFTTNEAEALEKVR